MTVDKPLHWHQGLFLQPQHLQLNDKCTRSLLDPLYKYGHPHFWGIADLSIQEAGLSNKSFEILKGEFMFPNGNHVVYPGNALIQPRSFNDSWVEGEKPFTVYLGLRKWNQSGGNVTVLDSLDGAESPATIFVTTTDPERVPDLHGDGPPAMVRQLDFVLRIFWETEVDQLDNYNLIPIAELIREGEEIRLSPRFVPPCLTVSASDWIVKVIKEVRDQITSRCRQLEEYKNPQALQQQDFDLGFMVFLLALRSLNRFVPILQHISGTKNLHPWDVYMIMRELIGELSTFSGSLSATGERYDGERVVPHYDHENLYDCFFAVQNLVTELLEGITVGPGHLIRLEFDGRFYTGKVSETMMAPENRFWLVIRTETDPKSVSESMRRVAKLSAKTDLSNLIARAVPGIPLEYFPLPPPGLPRRAHSNYFRIDHTSPQWMDVADSRAVSFHWDNAPEDLIAEILIVRS